MPVPPNVELIDVATATPNETCILRIEEVSSGPLSKDNGAGTPVPFYFIDIGTIISRDAAKDWRPFAGTTVGVFAGVNTFTGLVGSLTNFRVGDVIDIYDVSAGVDLATARNVTAVDDGAGTITFDGAVVTTALGDIIRLNDFDTDFVGITLDETKFLVGDDAQGIPVYEDRGSRILRSGAVDKSKVIGGTDYALSLLPGSLFAYLPY